MTARPTTSRTLNLATLALAAFGALAATGAAVAPTPAEAKKVIVIKHPHFHHGHVYRRHYWRPGPVVVHVGGGCHWLKVRALRTGRPYWWHRYRDCVGY